MANDPVADAVAGAKEALAKANRFTQSVVGNSTNAFAPKVIPSHIGGVPSYHLAHAARKASDEVNLNQEAKSLGEGLKARMEQNKIAEQ